MDTHQRVWRDFPIRERPEAEAWLTRMKQEIEDGTWVPDEVKKQRERIVNVTFGVYAAWWIKDRRNPEGDPLSPGTKDKYEGYLRNHFMRPFGNRPMRSITASDIQKWWDEFPVYSDGRGKSGRQHAYTFLKAVFSTAATKRLEDGTTLIKMNPCEITIRHERTRHTQIIATPEELDRAYNAMTPKLRLAVYLAGIMALRRGEVLALRAGDVDLTERVLHVRHAVKSVRDDTGDLHVVLGPPKTENSIRDCMIPDRLVPLIRQQISDYSNLKNNKLHLLFPGRHGNLINPSDLGNAWRKAREAVPRLVTMHFHDLRHTALTHLMMSGATIKEVEAIAGHSDIQMVMHYQHIVSRHEKEVVNKAANTVDVPSENPSGHKEKAPDPVSSIVEQLAVLTDGQREALVDALKAV